MTSPLNYLDSAIKEFNNYKSLADKTIDRLSPEQLLWRANLQSNSVAMIIRHMSGNMVSRFTNFLTEDGEKTWRNRDQEFEAPSIIIERATTDELSNFRNELINSWNNAWTVLFDAIASVSSGNLNTTVYIRNEPHSVVQAINRQIAHYAYHVGQIVFIGKCLVDNWASLSIPINASGEFNQSKGMK